MRVLSKTIAKESVDVIVTEPYLGPQRETREIEKAKKNLEALLSGAIGEFEKILKKDGRVVMIWPVLRKAKKGFLNLNLGDFEIIDYLPAELNLKKTERKTIVYGRQGQRVWREIVVLEKRK